MFHSRDRLILLGKKEREQSDMPHAILRVTNMTGIIVREFYLSFPEDLQRRFFSMFSGIGLKPKMNTGGEVKFEGECVCVCVCVCVCLCVVP